LLLLAGTFGGILSGRIISAVIDGGVGGYSPVIRSLYVVDLAGFLAAGAMLRFGSAMRV
jgi:hypothetical protein